MEKKSAAERLIRSAPVRLGEAEDRAFQQVVDGLRTTPLEDVSQDDGEVSASSPGLVGDRPAQRDANEQFRLELQSAVAEIPRRYRKPLELHLMQGLPYDMIAKELEIP